MAIEAQPGLQPERVARAEADGSHPRIRQQCFRQSHCLVLGHGNLATILTGVAGTGYPEVGTVPVKTPGRHEGQFGNTRHQRVQHGNGIRTLQGEQCPFRHRHHGDTGRHCSREMVNVGILAGCIDDQQQVIFAACDHQVVENATAIVEKQAVALLARLQFPDVAGDQPLQRRIGTIADQPHLAHVGDIEQPGRRARVGVLRHDAFELHRHVITGKGHHAPAKCAVQVVERGLQDRLVGIAVGTHHWLPRTQVRTTP